MKWFVCGLLIMVIAIPAFSSQITLGTKSGEDDEPFVKLGG